MYDSGAGCRYWGRLCMGVGREFSVLSYQFCCEPKNCSKKFVYLKKRPRQRVVRGGACVRSAELTVSEARTWMEACSLVSDVVALVTLARTVSTEWWGWELDCSRFQWMEGKTVIKWAQKTPSTRLAVAGERTSRRAGRHYLLAKGDRTRVCSSLWI